ncbi:hypothetical protein D9M70_334730 [compost metagenome]
MDELADLVQFRQFGRLLLEQVFDRLDVVVGGALDVLDTLRVLDLEVIHQAVQQGVGLGRERRDLGDAGVSGEALEPAHFDHDAEADQAVFAEDRAQGTGFAGIAAVDRGNRGERGKLHEGVLGQSADGKIGARIIHENMPLVLAGRSACGRPRAMGQSLRIIG